MQVFNFKRKIPLLAGLLFALTSILPAATEKTLFSFDPWPVGGIPPGASPEGTLLRDANGNLYGVTSNGGSYWNGTVYRLSPPTAGQAQWTFTVLYTFTGGFDGGSPNGNLVMDSSGALYGTTQSGGSWMNDGLVYKLSPPLPGSTQWRHSVIHYFYFDAWSGVPGDGTTPFGGLTMDASGNLYGVTQLGGIRGDTITGNGTVFKLSPTDASRSNWNETVLYRFAGSADGDWPIAAPTLDAAGNLYGTTYYGGMLPCDYGCGTIYKLSPPPPGGNTWTKTTIHKFTGAGGGLPEGKLLRDASGAFYGTTYEGGTGNCTDFWGTVTGCGTVFKITPPTAGQTNWTHTVLVNFTGTNGLFSEGGVIGDGTGALYGVTTKSLADGYGLGGYSMVYKLTPPAAGQTQWNQTILYKFNLGTSGTDAWGELVRTPDGRLYGVCYSGGSHYGGTVFEITP